MEDAADSKVWTLTFNPPIQTRLLPQQLQIPSHRLDAAIKIGNVEFLVGSVQVIVWEAEAHHDAGYFQKALERSHDGDGAAGAHVDGLLLEDLFHGLSAGSHPSAIGADH